MRIIGLCGGSGSGKGAVSDIFREYGYFTVDADKVYHKLISFESECTKALSLEFGDGILNSDKSLNRTILADVVFKSSEKLKKLNEISHFFVLNEIRKIIAKADSEKRFVGVIVDAPLLFESGFNTECDFVVAVISNKEKRIERIIKRDNISMEKAESRINNQLSDEYITSKSDFVIENNGTLSDLKIEVLKIIAKLS